MQQKTPKKIDFFRLVISAVLVALYINKFVGGILIIFIIFVLIKKPNFLSSGIFDIQNNKTTQDDLNKKEPVLNFFDIQNLSKKIDQLSPVKKLSDFFDRKNIRLQRRKKYLHIALNSTLEEAKKIISQITFSDRVLIEVGTPLIKIYGVKAISQIKSLTPAGTYIVADGKCADMASREVKMMANAGANAATCLGVAPIETIDSFIEECESFNIDSMVDMMNVGDVLGVLKKLKKLPNVVILHRGVDESEFSKEKQIPFYQIKQIKGNSNVLVAVAGGDTIKEVQRAIFNDTDIVVVWKDFYEANSETYQLVKDFLKEVR